MRMTIKNQLDNLSSVDTYSLILFTLFQLKNIPEYSTISELAYLLDKDSLLVLCKYFGGLTIKIPTIDELIDIVRGLTLYQKVKFENFTFADALKELGYIDDCGTSLHLRHLLTHISKTLDNYNFEIVKRNEDV